MERAGHYPLPDFYPCNACEMRGACKAAHHCAKLPRREQQPAVPTTKQEQRK